VNRLLGRSRAINGAECDISKLGGLSFRSIELVGLPIIAIDDAADAQEASTVFDRQGWRCVLLQHASTRSVVGRMN